MVITLKDISKRYGREWIFKQINYQFTDTYSYAITGPNGSGKSTLLKVIANGLVPTHGTITYSISHKRFLSENEINKQISYAAPYISLIEEFTLKECYQFHHQLSPLSISKFDAFLEKIQLAKQHQHKPIKQFSSGMKQKLKLGFAFCSTAQLMLLDEPTTNLDKQAKLWFLEQISILKNKVVIIGSNIEEEYSFCKQVINIIDYK